MFASLINWLKSVVFHIFSSPVAGEFEVVEVNGVQTTVQKREWNVQKLSTAGSIISFLMMLGVLYFWGFYGLGVYIVVGMVVSLVVTGVSMAYLYSQTEK